MPRQERQPAEVAVVGLDLSPTGSAAFWLPAGWSPGDWSHHGCHGAKFSCKDLDGPRRVHAVANWVAGLVEGVWLKGDRASFPAIFVEQYAFNQSGAYSSEVREVGGAVKYLLYDRRQAVLHPVVASQARKLLFGPKTKEETKGRWKQVVASELAAMGYAGPDDDDVRDAFTIANYGRYRLGLPCLAHESAGRRK
jgi:hypothetical protein